MNALEPTFYSILSRWATIRDCWCVVQPDPGVFTGGDKRVLNTKESEAYLALAFQGSSWSDEHAFPLMIMQTIMGGWDRSSGKSSADRIARVNESCVESQNSTVKSWSCRLGPSLANECLAFASQALCALNRVIPVMGVRAYGAATQWRRVASCTY